MYTVAIGYKYRYLVIRKDAPKLGDKITMRGEDYFVENLEFATVGLIEVTIARYEDLSHVVVTDSATTDDTETT